MQNQDIKETYYQLQEAIKRATAKIKELESQYPTLPFYIRNLNATNINKFFSYQNDSVQGFIVPDTTKKNLAHIRTLTQWYNPKIYENDFDLYRKITVALTPDMLSKEELTNLKEYYQITKTINGIKVILEPTHLSYHYTEAFEESARRYPELKKRVTEYQDVTAKLQELERQIRPAVPQIIAIPQEEESESKTRFH